MDTNNKGRARATRKKYSKRNFKPIRARLKGAIVAAALAGAIGRRTARGLLVLLGLEAA